MQEKIIELETKLSFQEDLLAELNDEIVRQQRQIGEIVRELNEVKAQLEDVLHRDPKQGEASTEHEKPPHY